MKKIIISLISTSSIFLLTPVYAGDSAVLASIDATTKQILSTVNNSYVQMQNLGQMINSWLSSDAGSSANSAELQTDLNGYYASLVNSNVTVGQESTALTQQFLNLSKDESLKPELNANTLVGTSGLSGDAVTSAQNYLRNINGSNSPLLEPGKYGGWPAGRTLTEYQNYYNSMAAIQSYNSFILSGLYADRISGDASTLNQLQILVAKFNDNSPSGWLHEVEAEPLGEVLRQILLFNSQAYFLMQQMINNQKQTLALQAMTNTLLTIQLNQTVGKFLQRGARTGKELIS